MLETQLGHNAKNIVGIFASSDTFYSKIQEQVLVLIGQLRPSISPGYGYTAIIAAFIGRLNPPGII
ncbi:ABC transporter permease [Nostoc sp. BAE]|nr:ABC transporter permease [Nostoc commune BAE]